MQSSSPGTPFPATTSLPRPLPLRLPPIPPLPRHPYASDPVCPKSFPAGPQARHSPRLEKTAWHGEKLCYTLALAPAPALALDPFPAAAAATGEARGHACEPVPAPALLLATPAAAAAAAAASSAASSAAAETAVEPGTSTWES
ncbi:unnamed protein product [Closterium sp. NIES-54]